MSARRDICDRCGRGLPAFDVTPFGGPPAFAYGYCPCPRPRCPFCTSALLDGRCFNVDCFMCLHIIPIPEMAP